MICQMIGAFWLLKKGKALLLAGLLDMKLKGYQYAVIGLTNLYEFYGKAVGAVVIPDSFPGFWAIRVREN